VPSGTCLLAKSAVASRPARPFLLAPVYAEGVPRWPAGLA